MASTVFLNVLLFHDPLNNWTLAINGPCKCTLKLWFMTYQYNHLYFHLLLFIMVTLLFLEIGVFSLCFDSSMFLVHDPLLLRNEWSMTNVHSNCVSCPFELFALPTNPYGDTVVSTVSFMCS